MNSGTPFTSRRQIFQSLLGLSLGKRLWSATEDLSEQDIADAIKYGRKWSDANNFLIDGLEQYRNYLIDNGNVRITVTLLTDWTRIALGSAWQKMLGKESDPADWRQVAKAGRVVAMVMIVSPGMGRGALSKSFYGDGKAYSVIRIDENTIAPIQENTPPAEADRFPEAWVPTVQQLYAMLRNTKGSVGDFVRILPRVEGKGSFDPNLYQVVFLLNAFRLGSDRWARKAEFQLFDREGRKMSVKVNLSKLR